MSDCGLDDVSATALFDMIEYYEAANELDISENRNITNRGWQACINMVKRSHALQILSTRGTPLSETNAISLGKSMLSSSLHTLKLEHCGLSGRPMASLCTWPIFNYIIYQKKFSGQWSMKVTFNFVLCINVVFAFFFLLRRYLFKEKQCSQRTLVGAQ